MKLFYFKKQTTPLCHGGKTIKKHVSVKGCFYLSGKLLKHPVQVPWWDVPRRPARPINLLKLSPRPQIIPPRPKNE